MGKKGTLFFFTGLAGAGKSTIGGAFFKELKKNSPDAVLLDGHLLRDRNTANGTKRGYTTEARLEGAWLLFEGCLELTDKGQDVVLCSICMYEVVREWARENIENYKEIYIRVPMEVLYQRDQGRLYSSRIPNVVGVDLPWDEPQKPDVLIDNDGTQRPEDIVKKLVRDFNVC